MAQNPIFGTLRPGALPGKLRDDAPAQDVPRLYPTCDGLPISYHPLRIFKLIPLKGALAALKGVNSCFTLTERRSGEEAGEPQNLIVVGNLNLR